MAARGKIKNYKKGITIFSCYLPPKLSRKESQEFMEVLADAVGETKSTSNDWVLIGGDWNMGRSGLSTWKFQFSYDH